MRGLFDCMVQLSTPVCRYQKHVVCVTIYLMCCFNYSGFFFKHRIQHIQIVVTMKSVLPQHLYQAPSNFFYGQNQIYLINLFHSVKLLDETLLHHQFQVAAL